MERPMSKFKMYVVMRKFRRSINSYDYMLYTGPRTFLEPDGLFTKREAAKRGKELAKRLCIEFREDIREI